MRLDDLFHLWLHGFSWYVRPGFCQSFPIRPFFTAGRAVRLDDRGINAVLVMGAHDGGQVVEKAFPDTAHGPPVIPIVHCGGRTVFRRTVLPSTTRLQHMGDPADNPPIILALRPCVLLRKMFLKNRLLQVV